MLRYRIRLLSITIILLGASFSNAQKLSTKYDIDNNSTDVVTEVKKSNQWDDLMRGYLYKSLQPVLLDAPYISSIQATHGKEEKSSYSSLE